MKISFACLASTLLLTASIHGQATPDLLRAVLEQRLQPPEVTFSQLREYLTARISRLPDTGTPERWTEEQARLRKHLRDDIILRGWPPEWVHAPLRVEDRGAISAGTGYRMRKLRYEIVPGFWGSAIVYEPAVVREKAPAILNVNGHVGPSGKAVEYKQKRCINQALQGIIALNLEWFGYGDLSHPENQHWFGAHLDLAGANAAGLFYLAMRKGLDYLYSRPDVDRSRIGMTGLSGGGWQTIILSALDERISVAVPVAGFSSFLSRMERMSDIGDIEQNATDLFSGVDYAHLAALRAPRPTLLIYNAEDDCCFRAALTRPDTFEAVVPFFRIFGQAGNFAWHENLDPATHNYQLDNRLQAYRFFSRHFGMAPVDTETPVDAQIKTPEELAVGLPADNLTILELARRLAAPSGEGKVDRETIRSELRFRPVQVARAWRCASMKHKGLEAIGYRFAFDNGLSATGVWIKAISAPGGAPATILIHDAGRKSAAEMVSDRVNRGEQVLALDLLFTGDMAPPERPGATGLCQLLATFGDRPIAIEAAQLIGVARWLASAVSHLSLESKGMRSHVAGVLASALEPELFSSVRARDGLPSWRYLLDKPVPYQSAPDLFCFGCYHSLPLPGSRP